MMYILDYKKSTCLVNSRKYDKLLYDGEYWSYDNKVLRGIKRNTNFLYLGEVHNNSILICTSMPIDVYAAWQSEIEEDNIHVVYKWLYIKEVNMWCNRLHGLSGDELYKELDNMVCEVNIDSSHS